MKKVGWFVLDSLALFGSYLLVNLPATAVLQTLLRAVIPADSFGERLWKTLVSYGIMAAVAGVHLFLSGAEHKRAYLATAEGWARSVRTSLLFAVRHPDFWLRTAGFAIWPVGFPKLFGAINRLYVSAEFLASFPPSVLVLATVVLPYIILHLGAWMIVTLVWHRQRMHK